METYEIMRIGFYICLGVAVLFLVLSVLLFFMFDVPGIIASRNGKTRAKTIKEMEETNSSTGRLMQKKKAPKTTGNLDKHKVVVKKGVVTTPEQISGSGITDHFNKKEDVTQPADEAETAVLGADSAQTAALDDAEAQTAVLGADDAQTAVLGADDAQTAVLGADAAETAVLDGVTQRFGNSETAVLVQSASVPAAEGVRFEIIKKVIVCDTEEIAG